MKTFRIYTVDVFTNTPYKGNAAGVVTNADGLSDDQMQSLARELNLSETAFVLQPDGNDHDVRLRFFTPTREVPVCGHATIAAHATRARELWLMHAKVRQKTAAGINEITINKDDRGYRIGMQQPFLGASEPLDDSTRDIVLDALGIAPSDLDSRFPVQVINTGHSKLMIGLRSRSLLDNLNPDQHALLGVNEHIGSGGYFLFTTETPEPSLLSHCRMFAPQLGIPEDPVTGMANGALGAYLALHEYLPISGNRAVFYSRQGEAMGRPGEVRVEVEVSGKAPVRVTISGYAVQVIATSIQLVVGTQSGNQDRGAVQFPGTQLLQRMVGVFKRETFNLRANGNIGGQFHESKSVRTCEVRD